MTHDDGKTSPPDEAPRAAPEAKHDVVFVHGPSEDGNGVRVLRHRPGVLQVGELRATQEGKPIHGEVVKLTQRKEHQQLFDVEVLVPEPSIKATSGEHVRSTSGPAQVASDMYRANWDAIFAAPKRLNKPPN